MNLPTGYTSRAATLADLDAVDGFFRQVDTALFGRGESTRAWVEEAWLSDWVDLPSMTRLVFADDRLVGSADLEAVDPSKEVGAFARVHPDHLGRGLGTALLVWTEEAAAGLIAPGSSTSLRHSIAAVDDEARDLLERAGFRHVRTSWHMRMDLPTDYEAGSLPAGIDIRASVAGDDDVGIWETMDSAFRTHFGFQPIGLEQWWDNMRRASTYDPSLILVAVYDSQIVGASSQYVLTGDGTGWVGELGVRPEWQRRGIGSALLRHALADLSRRGLRAAELNVDSQNDSGAVQLYRAAGMAIVREWLDYERAVVAADPD